MDRLKNPGLWCAFIVAALAALIHGQIWPDGSKTIKLLTVASEIVGVAGSLFFGAGVASSVAKAVPPAAVLLGVLLIGGTATAKKPSNLWIPPTITITNAGPKDLRVASGPPVRTLSSYSIPLAAVQPVYVEPGASQLAADTRAQPIPTPEAVTPTDIQKAAAVIAALGAAAQNAQQGLANAPPVVKAWTDTRAGQIVMGCIAGAIIVTSAAGAAAGVIVSLQ